MIHERRILNNDGQQDSLPLSEKMVKVSMPQEVLPATESKTDLFASLQKSKQGISWQELCAAFEKHWGEPLPNIILVRYGPHAKDVLIGKSAAAKQILSLIRQVSPTDATVLLQGPSGTGKGAIARSIYTGSPRRNKQFVPVNCASIAETLFESEMFGYERGAFTGADTKRLGRFELAHSGTLFLDQVFDISLSNQAKLLNALEDNEMWPIGSVRPTPIDVRVIAATNVPLRQLVDQGAFRQDLYQRLKVVVINLPPLKQRLEDIVVLARFFVTFFGLKEKKHEITNISGKCWEMLIRYPWPGNVRELKNTIHNAVIFASGPMLLPEHMVFDPVTGDSETSDQLELQLYRDFSPRKLQSRVKDLKRIIQTTTWKGVCSNKLAAHFHVGKRQAQRLLKPLKSQNLFSFK